MAAPPVPPGKRCRCTDGNGGSARLNAGSLVDLFRGRPAVGGRTLPLVLMYHATPSVRPARNQRFSVASARFARHLDLLVALGYVTVRLRDLADPAALPANPLVITFDDGYRDNLAGAFEPLQARGMCATWFAVSGLLGRRAAWLAPDASGAELMAAADLRALAAAGMEVGSHTRTHPDLTRLDGPALEDEIAGSRRELEDLLGAAVTSFAYPFGRFGAAAEGAVAGAGYRLACSVRPGRFTPEQPLRVPRISVFRDDSPRLLARKLLFVANDARWPVLARYAWQRLCARLAGTRTAA